MLLVLYLQEKGNKLVGNKVCSTVVAEQQETLLLVEDKQERITVLQDKVVGSKDTQEQVNSKVYKVKARWHSKDCNKEHKANNTAHKKVDNKPSLHVKTLKKHLNFGKKYRKELIWR